MEHSKCSPDKDVRSDTGLPKKDRNILNKQPNTTSIGTVGRTTTKIPD